MKRALVFMLLAVVVASASLSATTVLYVPMKKSLQMSDMVVVGHVLAMEATYNAEREIVTEISLLVEEGFKGFAQAGDIVKFHAWGGTLDGVHMETSGEARYQLGEKVLVQLENIQGELPHPGPLLRQVERLPREGQLAVDQPQPPRPEPRRRRTRPRSSGCPSTGCGRSPPAPRELIGSAEACLNSRRHS